MQSYPMYITYITVAPGLSYHVTYTTYQQTNMMIGRGTSSSKCLCYVHSSHTRKGSVDVEKTLNKKGVRDFQSKARSSQRLQVSLVNLFQ